MKPKKLNMFQHLHHHHLYIFIIFFLNQWKISTQIHL